nr:hypothetical protein BaRGS_005026 [Batillaria attramentaria]
MVLSVRYRERNVVRGWSKKDVSRWLEKRDDEEVMVEDREQILAEIYMLLHPDSPRLTRRQTPSPALRRPPQHQGPGEVAAIFSIPQFLTGADFDWLSQSLTRCVLDVRRSVDPASDKAEVKWLRSRACLPAF